MSKTDKVRNLGPLPTAEGPLITNGFPASPITTLLQATTPVPNLISCSDKCSVHLKNEEKGFGV